ncbi:MAG: flagellar basal body protein [Roseococcus sp.]|nr:flagellar basal body protein [Roseococcus sp.]
MTIDLAFGIARSGLSATQRALAQVTHNIANADTPGHTRKNAEAETVSVGGQPLGVRLGEARRSVDQALIAERHARGGEAAAARLRERLLAGVEAAHGTPGGSDTLGGALGALREGLIALRASPGEAGLQREAREAARSLALRFQEIAGAVGEARQRAQDGIVEEVARINATLREVADLTERIRQDRVLGVPTGDLEDKRDLALDRLSESLPVRALHRGDGGLVLVTQGGLALPLDPRGEVFATERASVGPEAYHGTGGTLPGITFGGVDVTRQLAGGRLGELVALRDATLPRYQAELDLAAAHLAARFDAQGLRLFTGASGQVPDVTLPYNAPAAGIMGFANQIRLSDAVAANPALIRDGTHAVADTPGGPSAFAPNPPGGPEGFSVLLDRLIAHAMGETVRPGTAWASLPVGGLGPDGSLASPFLAPRSLEAYAGVLAAAQAGDRAAAAAAAERAESLRRGLDARFQNESGVDTDAEMSALIRLQNAYAANARVLSTAQAMWETLLGAVR